ncbi:MAG: GntR family transcriptional regulator [Gemmatimonadetes bacterium]|nr:GntR family transcriptional regulator [Gemmatimonadota bacterium]MBT7863053.1 GntR family transcriptional regulator [Gemmatimonadota bacterium]
MTTQSTDEAMEDLTTELGRVKPTDSIPAYQQIATIITSACERGKIVPGTRLPPERSLASICRVSRSTIRQALDLLVDKGQIIKHTGRGIFVREPDVQLAVGCVFSPPSPQYQWGMVMSQAIVSEVSEFGWRPETYLLQSEADESRLLADCSSGKVHGLVGMFGGSLVTTVPVVEVSQRGVGYEVSIDYYSLTRQSVEYLYNRGCRRIGASCYGRQRPEGRDAMQGLRDAMGERDLEFSDKRVIVADGLQESGAEAVDAIWDNGEQPDGMIFIDDWQGLGGTRRMKDRGIRVPEDVAVVSHVNRGYSLPYPFPVVGIQVDPQPIAREMVQMLSHLMAGETLTRRTVSVVPSIVDPGQ